MQSLLYSQWDTLEISDVPTPAVGPNDVLVRVAACGICGSELEGFRKRSPRRQPPIVMGHEFCGRIEAVGSAVQDWIPGQKVVSNSLVPCENCVRCRRGDTHLCADRQVFGMHREGAFAELVTVPASCLLEWPEEVPAVAACLAEPLANGIHMVNIVRHHAPQNVLILGCGPIGLMALQAFRRLLGCTVWAADLNPARTALASRLGAEAVYNPAETDIPAALQALTEGEGADLVIDAVGSEATKRLSLAASRPGGSVVWIGLHADEMSFSSYAVTLPERHVHGTYGATMAEMETALHMMKRGEVDLTSWTHLFPLDEGVEAFQRMLAAKDADIKAVVMPGEGQG